MADGQVGWVTVTNKRPGTLNVMLLELFSEELGVIDLLYLLISRKGDLEFYSLQISFSMEPLESLESLEFHTPQRQLQIFSFSLSLLGVRTCCAIFIEMTSVQNQHGFLVGMAAG